MRIGISAYPVRQVDHKKVYVPNCYSVQIKQQSIRQYDAVKYHMHQAKQQEQGEVPHSDVASILFSLFLNASWWNCTNELCSSKLKFCKENTKIFSSM